MAKSDLDAPTLRILLVAEAIADDGPLTLVELTQKLKFSRGAIWRALDTLRGQGWVRMRAGDSAFEMCSALVARLSNARPSLPALEANLHLFQRLAATGPVHVDFGHFPETGRFSIVESTRKSAYTAAHLSLVDDDLAIAAQLTLPPPVLVTHLRAFMVTAPEDQRRVITSGEHGRSIAKLRDIGHLWADDRSVIAISLRDWPGHALRAELWRHTKADLAMFQSNIAAFLADLDRMMPYRPTVPSNAVAQARGVSAQKS